MDNKKVKVHPYIPNSEPKIRAEMYEELGIQDASELFNEIPEDVKFHSRLDLPEPLLSEYDLKRHVVEILKKNKTCQDYLNFLGAGCWQHYVPAVCDAINSRAEFVTAYDAGTYTDLGKYQALFEYQSMMAELLDTDVVSITYDWLTAISSSLLMATRVTGHSEILVPEVLDPEKYSHINNFCRPVAAVQTVKCDWDTGQIDFEDLKKKLNKNTSAVYLENPNYFGILEEKGHKVAELAHEKGAFLVVGVDPMSLGLIAPPSSFGADITCGTAQPFGIHMNFGGGLCGFIGSKKEFVLEHPSPPLSVFVSDEGEYTFTKPTKDQSSYIQREKSKDFTGSLMTLWSITAGVYLALVGPQGLEELGNTIMTKVAYAKDILEKIPGVKTNIFPDSLNFKEFVVNFDETDKTVEEINKALLQHKIFGGKDLSKEFPGLGNSALYAVTEIHTAEDLEKLAEALKEVL